MGRLTYSEQELHINSSRDEDFATAYCSDKTWITKMDKLVSKAPNLFKVIEETDIGKTYQFPKQLISIRSSIVKRNLSSEQRNAMAARLKSVREQHLHR